MKIDAELLNKVLGLDIDDDIRCNHIGLVDDRNRPNLLTFIDDVRFLSQLEKNPNVKAVLITKLLTQKLNVSRVTCINCDDPRHAFYTMVNYLGKESYKSKKSVIDPTACIHPRAYVSSDNVHIGKSVFVEANVSILNDVTIGDHSIVRAGAVLGSEGFEHKRTKTGILSVFHDGKVIIGNSVEIGANTCVDKGFSYRHTQIDDHTKLDNLVHVGHCAHLGKRCHIVANAMIGGSASIGNDVWIGPNSTISNGIVIGDGAMVTLGAVVTKNIAKGERVSGHFAIPHSKWIE